MRRSRSVTTVAVLIALGVLAGPVSGASASAKGIKTAFKRFDSKVLVAEGHVVSAVGTYKTTKEPAPVVAAIEESVKVIGELRTAIVHQSAGKPKVKEAKRLIVAGLTSVIDAYTKLKTAISEKGTNEAAAQAEAKKADETVKHAHVELKKGVKLLGG